jgi:pimeloyl-ACP methyl ester carboxylesterase
MQTQHVAVRDGAFNTEVWEAGSGAPVLYLHGEGRPTWTPFHDALARRHRVIAPLHPGYGGSTGNEKLQDLTDLLYYYLDFLDQLGLRGLPLIGHGLGGMVAAELAAVQPDRFTALVLVAPMGLWLPDDPVQDFFVMTPAELAAALYHDPASPAARAASETPTEGDALIEFHLERAKSLATAAKYLWPIPNRGLAKRTHRIAAPTLIVWGASDGIASPRYAEALRERIAGARVTIVEEAGHLPHEEQPAKLAEIVSAFLAEEGTHADEVRHLPGTVPPSGRQPAART